MKRGAVLFFLLFACGTSSSSSSSSGGDPTGPSSSSSSSGGVANGPCDPANTADIEIVSNDLAAYPPYAVAGCEVVYVSTTGSLMRRNLATRIENEIAPAMLRPRRPSMSTEIIAFEGVAADGKSVVYQAPTADPDDTTRPSPVAIAGAFTFAGEPRVSGSLVSFTGWNGTTEADDCDVFLWDATKADDAKKILGGTAQQRFSDVSDRFVAATDFAEDPDGRYDGDGTDLADIVVYEIATGAITKRAAPAKQAFPMLAGDDLVAYLQWNEVHPEPKLQAYDLRVGRVGDDVGNDRTLANVSYITASPVRPAASNGMIEWVANPDGTTVLWRAPASGTSAPVRVAGLDGLRLYAPTPSSAFTLLATEPTDGTAVAPRLRALHR